MSINFKTDLEQGLAVSIVFHLDEVYYDTGSLLTYYMQDQTLRLHPSALLSMAGEIFGRLLEQKQVNLMEDKFDYPTKEEFAEITDYHKTELFIQRFNEKFIGSFDIKKNVKSQFQIISETSYPLLKRLYDKAVKTGFAHYEGDSSIFEKGLPKQLEKSKRAFIDWHQFLLTQYVAFKIKDLDDLNNKLELIKSFLEEEFNLDEKEIQNEHH